VLGLVAPSGFEVDTLFVESGVEEVERERGEREPSSSVIIGRLNRESNKLL